MKRKLVKIFYAAGVGISYIFPLLIVRIWRLASDTFKSGYIKKQFKSCGDNFSVRYPFYYLGLEHITIGDNFSSFPGLRIEAHSQHLNYTFTPEFTIGNNVSVNHDCHFGCSNKVHIGNNVLIASKVFITDHQHGHTTQEALQLPPSERKLFSKGPVIVEDNVWIGEGVSIMPGVTIGANSIIGANAVVTKSFPANSVIGGIPAKLIKTI